MKKQWPKTTLGCHFDNPGPHHRLYFKFDLLCLLEVKIETVWCESGARGSYWEVIRRKRLQVKIF
jgi:hypothetical protein